MQPFHPYMDAYRKQMAEGAIPRAYQGLMSYLMSLRTHFQNQHPGAFVSGSLYEGYMDMTYFSFIPEPLKPRKLKIAIVFIHPTCRFEIWLAAANKQVQSQYWRLFKESGWDLYPLVPTTQGADAILEFVADEQPDFRDLDALTRQIEATALKFAQDVESFLAQH